MRYICSEDIENMAAQGMKELILDETMVLTEVARETAHQIGFEIISGSQTTLRKAPSSPAKTESSATSSSPAKSLMPVPADTAPRLPAKPKGCQHGPLATTVRPAPSNNHLPKSEGVVDQLVELVRQSLGKRSSN